MNDAEKRFELGKAVEERRHALGLSQMEAAVRAGISAGTWRSVEKHDGPVRKSTLTSIDRALMWPFGTAIRVVTVGTIPSIGLGLEALSYSAVAAELQRDRDFDPFEVDDPTPEELADHRRRQKHLAEVRRFVDGERETSPGPYPPDDDPPVSDALRPPLELAALSGRLDELSPKQRAAIEMMIEAMLDDK